MNAFTRYAAILGLTLLSAQAQALQFDFLPNVGTLSLGNGNTYTAEVAGLTVTASAWSSMAGKTFKAGELNLTAGGMGAYGQDEKRKSSNADALGNRTVKGVGTSDLILFSFSSAVNLQSLTTYQIHKDSDLSLWAGIGTFSPDSMTSSTIGTATLYQNTNTVAGIRTVDLGTFTGSYDWLAVAARIGDKDDLAKLRSLTVVPVAQPVPDAATWMTMLAGLGLVGFAVKRRSRT